MNNAIIKLNTQIVIFFSLSNQSQKQTKKKEKKKETHGDYCGSVVGELFSKTCV